MQESIDKEENQMVWLCDADNNRKSLMNDAESQVEIALHIPLTLEQEASVRYQGKDVGSLARGVQQGGGGVISGMVQGLSQAAVKTFK